ncbi:bifunctional diaminohydroxyphosphoribosylaminopyrimidine deaminase/5-amino-6-(5-phosphoribosylamino)uracil reductase RibD [Desulfomicrobium sp. ZS1]|jgi:diaminohydroxyphosphoribosylaminopyrimidine deaminase/5-amino-6-(5-phosphoribosylamino)uracil reductase|uniref:bifunctional diaminohydroxyphosphoribosylaminopyrimidine deaminase/5-amino-6-(5-phosphoribosylamino)uracil reductase RibD n=1 Tax=Desulfomicrobium sp. ZS1 TaxID=2952228 RepID=UPI0020B24897|nr:bifunctional diaminohydroxyphosphoribosylaminopyrimidine deaminase/5-amino-6-(5-phosphoribosylamino)uracil reductase RibD [Desulfomicrobium sp. ZS1]UTF50360.1 bifunctional diaminohydroxyphosphoribosylaminopyrimidine deaminase/5-amino-6-(5-phosphoribosylamino)uracil reductase RibD [Desulfomicrobium sp. ZS1]
MHDERAFMDQAIRLAEQGRGRTAPNPCVGAVLVRDGEVVAEGWHTACGQPHAEVEALRDAQGKGVDPRGCTLYVTLEPCNHHGKTPPCTQAILKAGVPEVVVGCADPNPTVAGGGADFLRGRGVSVRMGVREQECRDVIADFLIWQTTARPYSILKLATTLDGKIATRDGQAAWISGEASRREVHRLRTWCQAVIVGGGTFRADNPTLTCRLPGYDGPQPLAVIVSRSLPDPAQGSNLLSTRPDQTIFWTTVAQSRSIRATRLTDLGVTVWGLPFLKTPAETLDLDAGLQLLRKDRGCHYTLTEGGGHLAGSMKRQGLVDELRIFQAMKVLGDEEARSAFAGRKALSMQDCWVFRLVEQGFFETDLYLRLRAKE